ncbi:MAG: glucose-6-phosphate dehydrogenase assembly protein OpcA [Chthoniobacteraceae bacterium]
MPAIETLAFGQPVEVGQIGRALAKLWDSDAGATTRASLVNFAIVCRGVEAMKRNTSVISEFTSQHACRALLVGIASNGASEPRVSAWINAHCHLSRAGAKQICCEQISFLFEGHSESWMANTLFANLDSDLPLYLWWQGDFPDPIDETLWAWVDRLIYDSQELQDARGQFALLRESIERAQAGLILCDLNWARSLHLRQALSQMFDHPDNLPLLDDLQTITIAHAPDYRSTALLLISWFAAQLKFTNAAPDETGFTFQREGRSPVKFDLRPAAGRSLSLCELTSANGSMQVRRDQQGGFFRVEVRIGSGRIYNHLLPAGSNETTSLLLWEIGGGSRHQVYRKALDVLATLL